jgi:phytol kinase
MEWKQLIIYSGIYLLLFVLVEIAYHKLKLSTELTRKTIHIASGLIALSFPLFFSSIISVIILCLLFLIILYTSKPLGLLASINNVKRETKGSTIFPIIVSCCFFIYEYEQLYIFYYLPILILALCDPMASLAGKKIGFGPYHILGSKKTLAGNLAFFLSCFIICYLIATLSYSNMIIQPIITSVIVALVCTVAEGVTINGYDNLTIPLAALGSLYTLKEIILG